MNSHPLLVPLARLPGRLIISWSMAGGVIAGGLLVALTTLAGRSSSGAAPQVGTIFFVLGAMAGIAHGGLLGYLSRNPARTRLEVLSILLRSLVWVIPGLLLAWVASLNVALTASVLAMTDPGAVRLATLAAAWVFALAACAWAAMEGLRGVTAAWSRWPDVRTASIIVSLVFAALLTAFLRSPPQIWFTHFRVTSLGAVILAFGATVWIALPVVIAVLGLLHRRRAPLAGSGDPDAS